MKNIDQDSVPVTVEEAIKAIVDRIEPADREAMQKLDASAVHFSLGMHLRNEWSLWEKGNPIVEDFKAKSGLFGHADDVSGLILEQVWRTVRGEPRSDAEMFEVYRKHWEKYGIDPKTGERAE